VRVRGTEHRNQCPPAGVFAIARGPLKESMGGITMKEVEEH